MPVLIGSKMVDMSHIFKVDLNIQNRVDLIHLLTME